MEGKKILELCEQCGGKLDKFGRKFPMAQPDGYIIPGLAVQAIVYCTSKADPKEKEVLLIKLGNDPYKGKWALPGGKLNYGEDPIKYVERALQEQCSIKVGTEPKLFGVYGDPIRDQTQHTVGIIYLIEVKSEEVIKAGDKAEEAKFISLKDIPDSMAYDNAKILNDFKGKL